MEGKSFERGANKFLKPITAKIEAEKEGADMLDMLLMSNAKINDTAGKQIVFSPAWVSLDGAPIISKSTISIIQGKAGSHKSRLAELFCSLLLSSKRDSLKFERYRGSGYCVAYLDTERNTNEDFPASVQRIRHGAGYKPTDITSNFYPVSIKQVVRQKRLLAVKTWIKHVQDDMHERGVEDWNLFVVLDVVTDCIRSFNDDGDSNALFDYLGNLCEEFSVSFLLLIHENPGTEKARGHVGSEGMNKANTHIQIGYEKKDDGSESDLIKVKFLKTRNAKKPEALYLEFSQTEKALKVADKNHISEVLSAKAKAGSLDFIGEAIERILSAKPKMLQQEIVSELAKELQISEKTALRRIEGLLSSGRVLYDMDGKPGLLTANRTPGKATVYSIEQQQDVDVPF